MLPFELTKDTPYLALLGELWSVFYEYFNRNWPCYKGFLLYVVCPVEIPQFCTKPLLHAFVTNICWWYMYWLWILRLCDDMRIFMSLPIWNHDNWTCNLTESRGPHLHDMNNIINPCFLNLWSCRINDWFSMAVFFRSLVFGGIFFFYSWSSTSHKLS